MRNPIKCLIAIAVVIALQTSGSIAADAEWDRTVLPRPPQPFEGVTKRTLEGSVAAFTSASEGATQCAKHPACPN